MIEFDKNILIDKKRRLLDLLFVMVTAFLLFELKSVLVFLGLYKSALPSFGMYFLSSANYIVSILIMLYVLIIVQKRSLRDIGLSYKKNTIIKDIGKDICRTIGILIVIVLSMYLYSIVMNLLHVSNVKSNNMDFISSKMTIMFFIYILLNAIFEELIVRGYLMTEIINLTNNKYLAIIVSSLFQTSYHLYQGLLPLINIFLIFVIFSIIFSYKKRIVPIVLCHFILDLITVMVK